MQRFYHGDPGSWWHLPEELLHAYLHQMSVLQAREALRQTTVMAVGSGAARKEERRRVLRNWERDARGGLPEPAVRPRDMSELSGVLGQAGIPMLDRRKPRDD